MTDTIPPKFPTVSSFCPITKNMGKIDIGSKIIPQVYHSFPQYLWANSQVSLFFIDILVRYPNARLISFGVFFRNIFPKPIIVTGMRLFIISIKIQKPIFLSLYPLTVLLVVFPDLSFSRHLLLSSAAILSGPQSGIRIWERRRTRNDFSVFYFEGFYRPSLEVLCR